MGHGAHRSYFKTVLGALVSEVVSFFESVFSEKVGIQNRQLRYNCTRHVIKTILQSYTAVQLNNDLSLIETQFEAFI